jgi:hypothetical protein
VAALWDGTGIDPWLPQRMAAESELTAAERRMYASWWGSFSDWIVRVNRGVLAGPAVDPHAVWAAAPLWTEMMAGFVAGPVTDTIGIAYAKLFGPDFLFDARPAVTLHLAQVTNRMVRTPDEVFSVISGQVAKAASAGESIPKIAARIDEVLSTTGTQNWAGRAVTVARTETIGALNAGRSDAFSAVSESLGGGFEQQWLATMDGRVRWEHAQADGQRVGVDEPFDVGGEALMFPGDPAGSAEMTANCRCTTLLMRVGETVDLSNRGYTSIADDEG